MRQLAFGESTERGKRYRVIEDGTGFFRPGDIVVALQTSQVPYCVREDIYFDGARDFDYDFSQCRALINTELMEV